MKEVDFIVPKDLVPYINCVMIEESNETDGHTNIPLYADGYPGIMFQQAKNGFYFLPKKKKLSELFLYDQTLEPASLDVKGPFKFVVFQLYPFASKYLLGINPKELNDDCFDLLQLNHIKVNTFRDRLIKASNLDEHVKIISELMLKLISLNKISQDDRIHKAIALILEHKGQIKVRELLEKVHLTERTFERKFLSQVGLTPKQFARIVQFQSSLHQLNKTNYDKLVEVGFDSGFSDQSHFIRAFKKYTGQTPSYYLKAASKN